MAQENTQNEQNTHRSVSVGLNVRGRRIRGIYRNGIHHNKPYPHRVYKKGLNVYNVKTAEKYVVCDDKEKKVKCPRSTKLVQCEDGSKLYIPTSLILPMGHTDYLSRIQGKLPKSKKQKKKLKKDYSASQEKRKEYRSSRKNSNEFYKKVFDGENQKIIDYNESIYKKVKMIMSNDEYSHMTKEKKKEYLRNRELKIHTLLSQVKSLPCGLTKDGSSFDYAFIRNKNKNSSENIKCVEIDLSE